VLFGLGSLLLVLLFGQQEFLLDDSVEVGLLPFGQGLGNPRLLQFLLLFERRLSLPHEQGVVPVVLVYLFDAEFEFVVDGLQNLFFLQLLHLLVLFPFLLVPSVSVRSFLSQL